MLRGAEAGASKEAVSDQQAMDVVGRLMGALVAVKEGKMRIDTSHAEVSRYAGGIVAVTTPVFCEEGGLADSVDSAVTQLYGAGYCVMNFGRARIQIFLSEEAIREATAGTAMVTGMIELLGGWQERRRGGGAEDVDDAHSRAMLESWGAGGPQEAEVEQGRITEAARGAVMDEIDRSGIAAR